MNNAYIPKKSRYDTVLSILKEQIDEYFKVDSDLNCITEITTLRSDGAQELMADSVRVLMTRRSQLIKGIHYNCQLVGMDEGEPVKEEKENE